MTNSKRDIEGARGWERVTSERRENAGAALVELACSLRLVETRRDRTELVEALCSPAVPTVVAFVNAHAGNLAVEDPQLHDDLMNADVLLRDGTGMAVLCKALHRDPGVNMNGTDLIPELLAANAGRSVALIGTQEPWLSAAADQIRRTSSVEVVLDGFSDEAVYVDALRETPVDLIVLGMGMPKQERIGTLLRETLTFPCTIVCGGAILDFLGGKVHRAPMWIRSAGFEWVWRLALEPRRLFRRYLIGNAVFLGRIVRTAVVMGVRRGV